MTEQTTIETPNEVRETYPFQEDERLARLREERAQADAELDRVAHELRPEVMTQKKAEVAARFDAERRRIVESRRAEEEQLKQERMNAVFQPAYPKDCVTDSQRKGFKERAFRAYLDLAGKSEDELLSALNVAERLSLAEVAHGAWLVALEKRHSKVAQEYLRSRDGMRRRWQEYLDSECGGDVLGRVFTGLEEQAPGREGV